LELLYEIVDYEIKPAKSDNKFVSAFPSFKECILKTSSEDEKYHSDQTLTR